MLKKRFIAGATCPHCGDLDSIVVEVSEQATRTYCVTCQQDMTVPETSTPPAPTREGETLIGVFDPNKSSS